MFRILICVVISLVSGLGMAQPPNQPDLDVTYIQRIPRNVGVVVEYPNDIPTPACTCLSQRQPGRGPFTYKPQWKPIDGPVEAMMVEEQQAVHYHWPKPGQQVTFIAHVKNHGGAPAPSAP